MFSVIIGREYRPDQLIALVNHDYSSMINHSSMAVQVEINVIATSRYHNFFYPVQAKMSLTFTMSSAIAARDHSFRTYAKIFTCSKLTLETLKQGVKYVQS